VRPALPDARGPDDLAHRVDGEPAGLPGRPGEVTRHRRPQQRAARMFGDS
jgi:hypothetical protein